MEKDLRRSERRHQSVATIPASTKHSATVRPSSRKSRWLIFFSFSFQLIFLHGLGDVGYESIVPLCTERFDWALLSSLGRLGLKRSRCMKFQHQCHMWSFSFRQRKYTDSYNTVHLIIRMSLFTSPTRSVTLNNGMLMTSCTIYWREHFLVDLFIQGLTFMASIKMPKRMKKEFFKLQDRVIKSFFLCLTLMKIEEKNMLFQFMISLKRKFKLESRPIEL